MCSTALSFSLTSKGLPWEGNKVLHTFLLNVLQFTQALSILLRLGTCLAPKETEDEALEIGDVGPRPLTGASSLCLPFDAIIYCALYSVNDDKHYHRFYQYSQSLGYAQVPAHASLFLAEGAGCGVKLGTV
jgi:hypothetical protein